MTTDKMSQWCQIFQKIKPGEQRREFFCQTPCLKVKSEKDVC